MNIVKVCKNHGNLYKEDCIFKTDNRWKSKGYVICKICKKESSDKYRLNPERIEKEKIRNLHKKSIDTLSNNYVKFTLSRKYKMKQKDIPNWMIPIKRSIIELRRKIRQIREEENGNK